MQSTFGVEVLESRSGSFVKIVTKKYRKISFDGFQRGELFLMTKRKERFANTKLRLMPCMRTSRYGFMITRGCLERTRKAWESLEAQLRTYLSALVLYDVADTIYGRKKRFTLNVSFTRYYLVILKVCHK